MKKVLLVLVLLLPMGLAYAQTNGDAPKTIKCTVERVYDGDNVGCKAKIGRKTQYHNFRIIGIDAPEVRGKQPYYSHSRDALTMLVLGREVQVEVRGYDSIWKRNTVFVTVDGDDVGLKQIAEGWAWFYPQYARTLTDEQKQAYAEAQASAALNKRGLWAGGRPIRPSLWRRGRR